MELQVWRLPLAWVVVATLGKSAEVAPALQPLHQWAGPLLLAGWSGPQHLLVKQRQEGGKHAS